ncbi:MAG TPA: hypothetical protein PLR02_01100 [Rhodocyclaceae bacterium]|nr:hypothetical protein [Rhodocyclaceae bacterium]
MKAVCVWRAVAGLLVVPVLLGCENSATAYMVDTNQHALILSREQPYFWSDEVNQAIVVSRLPHCQRKVRIHPGGTRMADMEVFVAGDRLWALHQGGRWYLASTERCLVQDWQSPAAPPGPLVGRFSMQEGAPVFIAAGQ